MRKTAERPPRFNSSTGTQKAAATSSLKNNSFAPPAALYSFGATKTNGVTDTRGAYGLDGLMVLSRVSASPPARRSSPTSSNVSRAAVARRLSSSGSTRLQT